MTAINTSEVPGAQEERSQTERVKESIYNPRTKQYDTMYRMFKVPHYKPLVSWYKSGDPNILGLQLENKITEITVIRTKYISQDLMTVLLRKKANVFLHLYITGLNATLLEPKIPPVKDVFYQLKELLDRGFPDRQVLVCVDPIIQNDNGLKVLELILRLLTEFDFVRMRKIRLRLLWYKQEGSYFVPANQFIQQRIRDSRVNNMLFKHPSFQAGYDKMMKKYYSIITVDNGTEAIIGVRELNALGYKNEWIDENGIRHRIIEYNDSAKKDKPIVNIISGRPVRCANRCVLCPWWG